MESGMGKMHNMIQDMHNTVSLTVFQRQLLPWNRRLGRMDFEKIKEFTRKDILPKDIANCKTPMCPYYIQEKQA